jgi:hypothetical protein
MSIQDIWLRKKLEQECCLSYWFPILQTIDGLNLPKTIIIKGDIVPVDLINLCDGIKPVGYDAFINFLSEEAKKFGLPVFMRTGLTSNKHDWENACYITDLSKIRKHVYNIVELSALADMLGLSTDVWVLREYLPVERNLIATGFGNMPVTRERRYFIDKGKVVHHQHYWIKEAVKEGNPNKENWEEILKDINYESYQEIKELTELSELVGKYFNDYWSVDWLFVNDKWYLTDMARGECSFKYEIEK